MTLHGGTLSRGKWFSVLQRTAGRLKKLRDFRFRGTMKAQEIGGLEYEACEMSRCFEQTHKLTEAVERYMLEGGNCPPRGFDGRFRGQRP